MKPILRVARAPSRPVMIYDGDCGFCVLWVNRWRSCTGSAVEYVPLQDPRAAAYYPELTRQQLERSVHLIGIDGTVCCGAEAVFRSLASSNKVPLWFYAHVLGLAPVAEFFYRFVAQNRQLFSFATRLLWGRDVQPPAYRWTRWLFLRLLGVVYLVAFASLWTQVIGLVGHNGIVPADKWMESVNDSAAATGWKRFWFEPTLCWINAGDSFLQFQCGAGVVLGLLLVAGVAPAWCCALLWLLYLSLTTVCGVFLGFQWDNLLLEAGFLAIFFAPWQLWPRPGRESPVPKLPLWLLRWLLFRLMFSSGCVKLLSGDPTWRHLTALNFHYGTQPLPTWVGWYAHQLPEWFQKGSTVVMFGIELIVPILVFLPRRPRLLAFWLFVVLQVVIALTGNYTFFNLLALLLCVVLLDDARLSRWIPARWRAAVEQGTPARNVWSRVQTGASWVAGAFVLLLSGLLMAGMVGVRPPWPRPLIALYGVAAPLRSVNGYGLFAVMTTTRPGIVVEGSNDGAHWTEYEFKYKPGDLKRRPAFVAPHQPRLDWQMWFAALGEVRGNPWFVNLCVRLLQGSPEVLALFERNPFPNAPPRYIRARLYEYRFTNFAERRATGAWWRRELKGEYCPVLSLAMLRGA